MKVQEQLRWSDLVKFWLWTYHPELNISDDSVLAALLRLRDVVERATEILTSGEDTDPGLGE